MLFSGIFLFFLFFYLLFFLCISRFHKNSKSSIHSILSLSTIVLNPGPNSSFFSVRVFFHEHSRFTGQQEKGESISLTPLYHFHPLHRHLDISRAITAENSPLHIASSQTGTGNLWFPSTSR